MVTKGEGRGRINKEFETSRYMLLHINWINSKHRELYSISYNNL